MKTCPQCHLRYPSDGQYCFVDGSELVTARDPRIGTTIAGRYVLEDVLGEGGMATVYRARHKLVDRACAVKIMSGAVALDRVVRERFRREAKSTQQIAHPNIVEIFEQGETEDGTPFIIMELLEGCLLAEVIAKGPVPVARAVPIMIQMARGIARAHDLGVVHRDLKPENTFLVRREDGSDLVKLLDFGIARARNDTRLTGAGELFGTPQYMAPERLQSGDTGPNVDLYALGVVFFEMLTGRLPFEAPDVATFLVKHIKETPPAPRALNPDVPPALEELTLQLLAKDPKARPVDAHRVQHDLVAFARASGLPIPVEPDEDPASTRPPAKALPPVTVHQWARRAHVFERMLQRAFGSAVPKDLLATLTELKDVVTRATEVRAAAIREQHKLEEVDQRGREGRQRFGVAVEALGLDASQAKDVAREARARREAAAKEVKRAAEAFAIAQREVLAWEGRAGLSEPHPRLVSAYRSCADAAQVWLDARTEEKRLEKELEDKDRTVGDLEYQIRELRAALAGHEKAVEAERAAAEQAIRAYSRQAEELEALLLELAAKFCEPLRAKPELGPLFQQLESDAAA